MTTAELTDAGLERLLWHVELGGSVRLINLMPPVIGNMVAVELEDRTLGLIAKPTPQIPWCDAVFQVDGQDVLVALIWHVPVMRTDVFVGGRSARDGRPVDDVRRDAPAALTNYEVWLGGLFATPIFGSRPHPPRGWPVALAACGLIWIVAFAVSPLPPEFRAAGGALLAVSGVVLCVAYIWSMLAVGERVHRALLARPSLGDRRVFVWFAAFFGYALSVLIVLALAVVVLTG